MIELPKSDGEPFKNPEQLQQLLTEQAELLAFNWAKIGVITAFIRPHRENQLKYSILALIPSILKLADLPKDKESIQGMETIPFATAESKLKDARTFLSKESESVKTSGDTKSLAEARTGMQADAQALEQALAQQDKLLAEIFTLSSQAADYEARMQEVIHAETNTKWLTNKLRIAQQYIELIHEELYAEQVLARDDNPEDGSRASYFSIVFARQALQRELNKMSAPEAVTASSRQQR